MKRTNLIACLIIIFMFCPLSDSSTLPEKLRIISLAPSTTEILFALGLDEEIIGVSQFCNYPPQAITKERVGSFSEPNIEKILSLKPDIIFCTGLEQIPVITKLRQLQLNVSVSDPSNFNELFDSIREIGRLVNRQNQAMLLIREMETKIKNIGLQTKSILRHKKPKVFVEIWHSPLMTAGKGSFIDELITLAGGINIAHDLRRPYSNFSSEEVIKRNPDCIILAYMNVDNSKESVTKRFGWSSISAVKNNNIFNDINPDSLLRPGPRLIEGLTEVYQRLYPK